MPVRHHLAAALFALAAAAPAHAQFTAAVAPPRREKPAAQVAAELQGAAKADTARRQQLSDMRAWVDSAAAAATGRPVVRPDSTTAAGAPVTTPAPADHGTVALPNTATPLPLLALAGLLFVGAGMLMVREPARVRTGRRARREE